MNNEFGQYRGGWISQAGDVVEAWYRRHSATAPTVDAAHQWIDDRIRQERQEVLEEQQAQKGSEM